MNEIIGYALGGLVTWFVGMLIIGIMRKTRHLDEDDAIYALVFGHTLGSFIWPFYAYILLVVTLIVILCLTGGWVVHTKLFRPKDRP